MLPITPTPVLPTPSATVPVVTTPSPTASSAPSPAPATEASPAAAPGRAGAEAGGGGGGGGIPIPFTSIVLSSPLDLALAASMALLPLLFGIWLLVFGRTFSEARRSRDAAIRLALASDLGIKARELTSLSSETLFKLREQAAFDELTGVHRRASGIAVADREIARTRRLKQPLTVAFIDIDGLKETNDRQGHAAGDALLRGLTSTLKDGLRGQDLVFRYGGDEFVCLLPDTAEEAGRAKLRQVQLEAADRGIRFCFGIAEYRRSDDVVSLLGRADQELYRHKASNIVRPLPSRRTGRRAQAAVR